MTDITLSDIGSGYDRTPINSNFQSIETKINGEILHLTGGNNTMSQQIDMDSNRIINLDEGVDDHNAVNVRQLRESTASCSSIGNYTAGTSENPSRLWAGAWVDIIGTDDLILYTEVTSGWIVGDQFTIFQTDALDGRTVTPALGVTLLSFAGADTLAGQYAAATLRYRGNDTWQLVGNLK